jgi:hypothetical protein
MDAYVITLRILALLYMRKKGLRVLLFFAPLFFTLKTATLARCFAHSPQRCVSG